MYSEFHWLACPFLFFVFFTFCSRCGMKWDTAFGSTLSFFITWCAVSSSTPKQNLFGLGSWKKYILGIHPKKIIIPAPFHIKAIRVMKYKKYVAGKYTRARAPLARKYTNRIFESKDGTTSMKIVNYIERHNFCWNDLLTKSNRTEIQTYKVEERTFGTSSIYVRVCPLVFMVTFNP